MSSVEKKEKIKGEEGIKNSKENERESRETDEGGRKEGRSERTTKNGTRRHNKRMPVKRQLLEPEFAQECACDGSKTPSQTEDLERSCRREAKRDFASRRVTGKRSRCSDRLATHSFSASTFRRLLPIIRETGGRSESVARWGHGESLATRASTHAAGDR